MYGARRQFLKGGFLTRAGREHVDRLGKALGPAPPWHKAKLKQDYCLACDHPCVEACEMDVIRLHHDEHYLRGMPYLSFEQGGCTFCRACVDACPMDLGESADAAVGIGDAKLNTSACLAWNGVICLSCKFICNARAIRFDRVNRPAIDVDICTGCGMCVTVCPENAIAIEWSRGVETNGEAH